MKRRILFLSALDLKEKSIQVIRKTPEAYVNAGWDVRYIVARDTTRQGNYFYEDEINPDGVRIDRFPWPLAWLRNAAKNKWLLYGCNRLSSLIVIFQLARRGAAALRSESAEVLYGYEKQGVLAARLLRFLGYAKQAKIISRFQGTWGFYNTLRRKDRFRFLANLDLVLALRAPADLVIMTNDGTHGDQVIREVASRNLTRMRFWPNGVDIPAASNAETFTPREAEKPKAFRFVSVCRLVPGKGIERCIAVLAKLKKAGAMFSYRVVGDGPALEQLRRIARESGLEKEVTFVGAIPNHLVFGELHASDCFLSMYDNSNVGNPLLEAIRSEKLIVTLNNGGTGEWITHGVNGLIYEIDSNLSEGASRDLVRLINDSEWQKEIIDGVKRLSRERLWTWDDRMQAEVNDVTRLLQK